MGSAAGRGVSGRRCPSKNMKKTLTPYFCVLGSSSKNLKSKKSTKNPVYIYCTVYTGTVELVEGRLIYCTVDPHTEIQKFSNATVALSIV